MSYIRSRSGAAAIMSVAVMAAALGASAAAAADPSDASNYVTVSRAAVSPTTPREARASLVHLGTKAMEACGASTFSFRDYQDAVRRSPCWRQSMTDAIGRIGNPLLTEAYGHRASVEVASSGGGSPEAR